MPEAMETQFIKSSDYQSVQESAKFLSNGKEQIPVLELPTDFLRSPQTLNTYESIYFSIPQKTLYNLQRLLHNFSFDLETVLICVYANLLHRYSEQDTFCIATVNTGSTSEPHDLKAILQRFTFSDDLSFAEFVKNTEVSIKQPSVRDLVSIDKPTEKSSSSNSSMLRALFVVQTSDSTDVKTGNAIGDNSHIIERTASVFHADIILALSTTLPDNVICQICFNCGIFKKDFAERLTGHFLNLLEDSTENAGKSISELEILSVEEKHRIISVWNSTEHAIPESVCLTEIYEQQVSKQPDTVALHCGSATITHGELNRRSNKLARTLQKECVGIETPVAVCMERSIELIISILGIIKAGGTYVPIDPIYPAEHIQTILSDCNPVVILTKDRFKTLFSKSDVKVIYISAQTGEDEAEANLGTVLNQDNRFYIMYTSGSSGKPKGVEGIYRGIINRLYWMWDTYPYSENDICCHRTSIGFVDHIAEIINPLLKGVPLVIVTENESRNTEHLVDILIEYRISRVLLVPSLLQSILQLNTDKLIQLTNLRYIFSSGEALGIALARQFYQNIRNARLVNIYGSTEVSADALFYEIKRFFVGDVLKYFTQSIDLPGGLKDTASSNFLNPIRADRITTENVPIESIAAKFNSSQISDYPLTLEQYFKRLYTDVLPHVINTAAPTFVGHMTSALPDFVHNLSKLISQLNQNLVKIETAKSLIFLERESLAILHRCFYERHDYFYEEFIQKLNSNLGLVTTGGTTANITALLTARNKALFTTVANFSTSGKSIYSLLREGGYEDMTILGTHKMHYSIRKAISVLGLGIDTIMYVATDTQGRLDTSDLEEKIKLCRKRNILILAIIGIAGATETGQIDPLDEIGTIAAANKIHFHVDAAWGGTAIFSDKYKSKLFGIQKADSITFCGHKQLYLPQGISICLFKDPQQLQFATTTATYQATIDSYDVGKFTLEGSRSAISLCLHAALRLIGRKGYEALVNYSMDLTTFFSNTISQTSAFELIGIPQLNIVNYRYLPSKFREKAQNRQLTCEENEEINLFNSKLQEKQFLRGKTFVSKTTLTYTDFHCSQLLVFRAVLSNPLTTYADLFEVLEDQLSIAQKMDPDEKLIKLGNQCKSKAQKEDTVSFKNAPLTTEFSDVLFPIVPIGKPLYNCKTYILDKHLRVVPVAVPGDLYIAGAALSRGYFNNTAQTNHSFTRSPFNTKERLFKTGDRARYASDGCIEYLGRHDEQVKIRGYRIELAEIEYHISQIEDVIQCKVIAGPDKFGNKSLIAYVVLKDTIAVQDIKDILSKKIPEYMIPQKYKEIKAMPLLPNGKVDKASLFAS
jgi:putative pyridoxal-dependent aspartate 1-decarboxylase